MPNVMPSNQTTLAPEDIELPILTVAGEPNRDRFLDKPESNCGVIGIYNHPEASVIAYYALHALQHRGQEAAGILAAHWEEHPKGRRRRLRIHKDNGLVLDVFKDHKILSEVLVGDAALAHNRYSTTGASGKIENIQPFFMQYRMGGFGLAHNGNLTNTHRLREELASQGTIFQTSTDSELILHLVAHSQQEHQIDQIREALQKTRGAYSLAMLTDTSLVAARDPHGIRPLAFISI